MVAQGRIYTVKVIDSVNVSVNSAGFKQQMPLELAAKKIGCDYGELFHQLENRGGMTHVVRRGGKHWYT